MTKHCDFLVVGQGLAGTLLHFLMSKQKLVGKVIDKGHDHAASKVASGLINPITGRKFVKSWMFDQLKEHLDIVYKELEDQLQISILKDHGIVRTLSSIKEENLWYSKSAIDGYEKHFIRDVPREAYDDLIKDAVSFGEVTGGARLDMQELISAYRKFLLDTDLLIEHSFDYDKLIQDESGLWHYGDLRCKKIIFCEGWQLRFNPYFKGLGRESVKGEVLVVKLKNATLSKSIKKKIFITPIGNDLYWVGSTYDWDFENDQPTEEKRSYLRNALDEMLGVEYEIVDHWAGVRPATIDRRPLLGAHPKFSGMYVFSGLGTKGASLGPYWAKQMTDFICDQKPIPMEVDISRFS